ncbi:MAG: 4Fe-4S dicluster domain-containing protein [candidate division WOR-3 bacterium]|nr:MAG: 4Fe-4S dicluster domain-containing protein [candidate division WOR-3 bacterium]
MNKVKRKIINIDEELCNGCGNCIPACPEQALQIVETPNGPKARLVKEIYCDGLGACLGNCPTDALTLTEEEVEPYDEDATLTRIKEMLEKHLKHQKKHGGARQTHAQKESKGAHVCPGAAVAQWDEKKEPSVRTPRASSELRQWPVQIHLVPPTASYLRNADIAIIADCVPFAYANLHEEFLKGRTVLVGCPKFDDAEAYIEKIAQIIEQAQPKSIKVVRMEVPCCSGLTHIVEEARKRADSNIPVEEVIVGIKGEIE